jgi:uncharacterized protein YhjY with autotransporter beta-barrel domain
MKMNKPLWLALTTLIAFPVMGDTIINFDDLPTTDFNYFSNPYQGFNWTGVPYISTGNIFGLGGIVSSPNAGDLAQYNSHFTSVSGQHFTLVSMDLATASGGSQLVTVEGLNAGGQVVGTRQVMTTGTPVLFTFDYANITEVAFQITYQTTIDNIDLSFAPPTTSFASLAGLDANQRGIASSIDVASAGSSSAITHVTTALSALPTPAVAGALDQLSPAKFSSFATTTAVNNEVFATQDMDIYLQSMRDDSDGEFARGDGKLNSRGLVVNNPNVDPGLQMIHSRMLAWEDPVSILTDVPGSILGGVDMKDVKQVNKQAQASAPWDVFLRGNVILAQGFSQADVPHFDDNSESVVVGADYHFTPHLIAGVTASYAHTDATLDDFGSSATVDSYSPGIFASWADGGGYVNFLGRYSYNSYTEARDIAFLGQTANGATDGNEGVIDLDGGYDFHSGALTYGPVAGLQYVHLTMNSYSESGSDAALSVNEDQSDSLRSRLGGSVRYAFTGGGVKFTPHLEATWQHEFLSQNRGLTSQFSDFGGGSFTVRTPGTSDDSALVDLGLDAQVNQTTTVFGDYVVQAGQSDYFGQSLQAGVRVNF